MVKQVNVSIYHRDSLESLDTNYDLGRKDDEIAGINFDAFIHYGVGILILGIIIFFTIFCIVGWLRDKFRSERQARAQKKSPQTKALNVADTNESVVIRDSLVRRDPLNPIKITQISIPESSSDAVYNQVASDKATKYLRKEKRSFLDSIGRSKSVDGLFVGYLNCVSNCTRDRTIRRLLTRSKSVEYTSEMHSFLSTSNEHDLNVQNNKIVTHRECEIQGTGKHVPMISESIANPMKQSCITITENKLGLTRIPRPKSTTCITLASHSRDNAFVHVSIKKSSSVSGNMEAYGSVSVI